MASSASQAVGADITRGFLRDFEAATGHRNIVEFIPKNNYKWVGDFIADREARAEIDKLNAEIIAVDNSMIDPQELKGLFFAHQERFKKEWLAKLKNNLAEAQARRIDSSNGCPPEWLVRIVTPALFAMVQPEMDALFDNFPPGLNAEQRAEKSADLRKRIVGIEQRIAAELSPAERWIYRKDGKPHPYPNGCRWTWFVKAWKKVAVNYYEPVDLFGQKIGVADPAYDAYAKLALGALPKVAYPHEGC